MNQINTKRILKDITELNNNNLNSHGIYHLTKDDDLFNLNILMIGPPKTPYENGYYFFDINFPQEYPWKPPNVKFISMTNNIRFNPNLYINGKVCLSLINTWSGPKWTSCNTISTVLLSIQALVFNEFPLVNEPGFENIKEVHHIYNNVITYGNYYIHIYKLLKSLQDTNSNHILLFKDIILEHFINTYNTTIANIQLFHNYHTTKSNFICNTYNINVKNNTKTIIDKLPLIYKKFIIPANENNSENNNDTNNENNNNTNNDNDTNNENNL